MKIYFVLAFNVLLVNGVLAQNLYTLPDNFNSSSISSFENLNGIKGSGGKSNHSAKGNAFESLKIGQSKTLLEIEGPGIIQRMWFTLQNRSLEMMRALRLRIYWDGETKPAVDVPFGDFFGYGLSKVVKFETALFSNPEGRSFNCMIPMPFRKGAKVIISNDSPYNIDAIFFDIDFVKLEKTENDALYFHAYWTRQKSSELRKDFEFLPEITGKGRFLGVNIGVNADPGYGETWWGEGEVKMYIDNDKELPTINGTGTEDYIGTAWGMGKFTSLYQGCTVADDSTKQYAFYRFHIPDFIGFNQNFRASIQQIGGGMRDVVRKLLKNNMKLEPVTVAGLSGFISLLDSPKNIFDADFPNGWVNFYRIDDYSATSYFYLNTPVTSLSELPKVSERVDKSPGK
jgi:Protein of unknown function (DUF2961)